MKSIAGISLAALLACSPAFAQTQAPSDKNAPAAKSDTDKSMNNGTRTTGAPATSTPSSTANVTMNPDDRLASRIIGATIRNNNNESIGDINDLVIDQSGKVTGVIAGIGGFLGIGEHRVMLGFDQMQFNKDANGRIVVMSQMTRDQLKSLPAWRDPNSSDSSSGSGRTR